MRQKLKQLMRRAIRPVVTDIAKADLGNIKIELQRGATRTTAEFVAEQMARVQSVASWQAVHDLAASHALSDGLVLEFGVYSGKTINYISDLFRNRHAVYGFDSFEGLPETWRDGFDKGRFKRGWVPTVRPNVTLVKGWFEESLPRFLEERTDSKSYVAYLHIDCDLYSSTKTVLVHLKSFLCAGTVIIFDEYFNYSGWERGEYLAFNEFAESNKICFEYITYNYRHEQVAIRLTSVG